MQIHNLEITKKEKSLIEIRGEIGAQDFKQAESAAIEKLGESLEIDGFRKGKAPKDVVVKKLGEAVILEEMAQITLTKAYPQIITEQKIDAIGYPQIQITKLAKDNPLGFTIMTAVIPEITLPDYKKIARAVEAEKTPTEISDEEFKNFIKQLQKAKAHEDFHKANPDVHDHNHAEVKDEDLPELTLAYVQTLGDFKDMQDFETKVKADMLADKKAKAMDKKRVAIIETIEKETIIEVPDILIISETEKMIARMKSDVGRMGLSYEDYLKMLQKTEEDIRKEMRGDAEKRAKIQMIVGEIAVKEKLKPNEEKLKAEMAKVMEAYKDVDERNARMYIENVLINEEVFKFLETL